MTTTVPAEGTTETPESVSGLSAASSAQSKAKAFVHSDVAPFLTGMAVGTCVSAALLIRVGAPALAHWAEALCLASCALSLWLMRMQAPLQETQR